MAKLYKDIFVDEVRKQINAGQFKTKQELINFLQDFNTMYFNNPEMMQRLKYAGINLKELDVNKVVQELLDYYDRGKTDISSLNLEGVSQVAIDGKDYIKVTNEDGTHTLLDDSMNDDNLVKQFNDRQNESYDYRNNNGVNNRSEIIKDMQKDKEEVNLTSSNKVDSRSLTGEEKQSFSSVMNMSDADRINFVVDPSRNIYINNDTGELYYTHKNPDGNLEVRRAEEVTSLNIENSPNVVDDMENDEVITKEQQIDFENLDNFELQYLIDNRAEDLTLEQIDVVKRILARREERVFSEGSSLREKGRQKVLKDSSIPNIFNDTYNGFTSVLYFFLVTFLFGIGAFICLLLRIYL